MAGLAKGDVSELVGADLEPVRVGARRTAAPWLLAGLITALLAVAAALAWAHATAPLAHPGLVESTPGQLAVWAANRADLAPEAYLPRARLALVGLSLAAAVLSGLSAFHLWRRPQYSRPAL